MSVRNPLTAMALTSDCPGMQQPCSPSLPASPMVPLRPGMIASIALFVIPFHILADCFGSTLPIILHRSPQDEFESPREPISILARGLNKYHLQWPIFPIAGLL